MGQIMKLRTQYIISTVISHFVAIAYLYIIDLRIVQVGEMKWDSDLGHTLLIPFYGLIGYAWLLIALTIFNKPQVLENDADWSAKAVHFTDKHKGLAEHC